MSFTLLLKKQIQRCTRELRLASQYWHGVCSGCAGGRGDVPWPLLSRRSHISSDGIRG